MTSRTKWITVIFALRLLSISSATHAQSIDPAYVINPRIAQFSELDYPHEARLKGIQGLVAVHLQLDDRGLVSAASSISGSKDLIPDTLANVKTWRFEAGKSKSAIIVFDFRLVDGQCAGDCRSQFLLRQSNLATITAAQEPRDWTVNPIPNPPMGYNEGLWPIEFADLTYPKLPLQARVSGIVVVQIQLDSSGKVTSAKGISGPQLLATPAQENALKWRFAPNPPKMSVIVYNFALSESDDDAGRCHNPCYTLTRIHGPNFVTITGPEQMIETQSTSAHKAKLIR